MVLKYSQNRIFAWMWAVSQMFNDCLFGQMVDVYTDHIPLNYLITSAKVDTTNLPWLAELAEYHLEFSTNLVELML